MTIEERKKMAKTPNTTPDVLGKMSADEHWRVRCGVAENPQTPADVLEKTSDDEDLRVRKVAIKFFKKTSRLQP